MSPSATSTSLLNVFRDGVTCFLGAKPDPHLAALFCLGIVESKKVPSEPLFSQAEPP